MGDEARDAQRFADGLAELYGAAVRSVVLYGSAARDQYREGSSDLNVLVLLDAVDAEALRRAAPLVRGWVQGGNPPPLMLSADELARSLDIFAIEYSDIRDAHRVLHGDDPFAGLEIRTEHLRLQCERELKGGLIQLREHFLLAADDAEELGTLLVRSVTTFVVLFRTLLRLTGDELPTDEQRVVRLAAERVGFDAAPMLRVLAARRGGEPLRPAADDPIVVGYLDAVARTVAYVDGLER